MGLIDCDSLGKGADRVRIAVMVRPIEATEINSGQGLLRGSIDVKLLLQQGWVVVVIPWQQLYSAGKLGEEGVV